MDFIALDLETANPDLASICQVGFVEYRDGKPVDEWVTLVDPQDEFSFYNVKVHGIEPDSVKGAPTFPDVLTQIRSRFERRLLVCHGHFDRVALAQGCDRFGLPPLDSRWLDTAAVARRAWSQFAWSGYGLFNLSCFLKFPYRPHDALEDAKACGHLLLEAIRQTGTTLEEWLSRVNYSIVGDRPPKRKTSVDQDGNPDGALFGEVIVFTGTLSLSRHDAAKLAADAGCDVDDNVTKKTSLLVVGNQDIKKLAGFEKSRKHRKAEEMILKGANLRILREDDFIRLVETSKVEPVQLG